LPNFPGISKPYRLGSPQAAHFHVNFRKKNPEITIPSIPSAPEAGARFLTCADREGEVGCFIVRDYEGGSGGAPAQHGLWRGLCLRMFGKCNVQTGDFLFNFTVIKKLVGLLADD